MHPTGPHALLPTSSDVLHPTVKAYLNVHVDRIMYATQVKRSS